MRQRADGTASRVSKRHRRTEMGATEEGSSEAPRVGDGRWEKEELGSDVCLLQLFDR
jgi:hypothetical protein